MSRFWFAKNDPSKYRDIYDKINIFEYYQKFVGDYEEVMRGWGYCVPEVTVDAIEKFGGVADRCEMQLHIQRSAKVGAPGLGNFITAVAYHICPSLPAAFTQTDASTSANLCTCGLNLLHAA